MARFADVKAGTITKPEILDDGYDNKYTVSWQIHSKYSPPAQMSASKRFDDYDEAETFRAKLMLRAR